MRTLTEQNKTRVKEVLMSTLYGWHCQRYISYFGILDVVDGK